MAGFTRRKIRQIKRFFADRTKKLRLSERAKLRGNRHKTMVFDANIEGEKRTVKLSPHEREARANIEMLGRAHRRAVSSGAISPEHYELSTVRYHYADGNVGIMDRVGGVGLNSLLTVISRKENKGIWREEKGEKNWEDMIEAERKNLGSKNLEERNHARLWIEWFEFAQDSRITREEIEKAFNELKKDLSLISRNKHDFSYDLNGTNNVRITGKTGDGKLKLVLVDQTYPGDEDLVRQRLMEKRANSGNN